MDESSRIAVYSVPCGLTWGVDVALFVGEVNMEAIALSRVTDCAFVGEADMEATASSWVTD